MKKKLILRLIQWLTSLIRETVTVASEQRKVEPLLDRNGKQVFLRYLGKDRPMYRYKNEQDMRIERSIWTKFFETEKELKIRREELSDKFGKIIQMLDKHEYTNIGTTVMLLKDWIDNLTPMEVLLNQAGIMIFDADENLLQFDGDHHYHKMQAMKTYPDHDVNLWG